MKPLYLYNTLSRQKEEFSPIIAGSAGIYTCGPTVYNFAHIGNLRTYLFEDWLVRTMQYDGYDVKRVMNVTDVGHLTDDGDSGEDKMEKGAARENKSAWEIAGQYWQAFRDDMAALNIEEPSVWCRATDYIPQQIALVKELEEKGYTYRTSDGIYFDTSKFEDYNKLSHLKLEDLEEGARVEINPEKKNPTDFALWKFSPQGQKRQMEWESPWGIGFPGWHVECSAMSLELLEGQLDIHCGGIDHINVHHTNEIAQSEAATGKKFFNYWMHGAFLNIAGGKKMAKSADNFLTVDNALIKKGLDPLAYRFAAAQVHYRKPMEYSEDNLRQANNGWLNLLKQVASLGNVPGGISKPWQEKFIEAVNDDLNIPQALAILQDMLKSDLSDKDRLATALDFDQVLGLSLDKAAEIIDKSITLADLPENVRKLVSSRQAAREAKDWAESDRLREEITNAGYLVEDTKDGYKISRAE